MTKKCVKCKKIKPIVQFYKQEGTKDGHRGVCSLCQYTPRNSFRLPKESSHVYLFNGCKNAAKFRDIEFDLTLEQHKELVVKDCHHCGAKPVPYNPYLLQSMKANKVSSRRLEEAWIVKNGIDRLDNDKGYNSANCVAACQKCNYGRQDYTVEEYINHCRQVVAYQEQLNEA